MMGWPHTATFEERGFTVVNMERVPSTAEAVSFPCMVEPLSAKEIDAVSLSVEKPQARISWPPISGKELANGDKVTYLGKVYELKRILGDIWRGSDPYYTAILCGGKA